MERNSQTWPVLFALANDLAQRKAFSLISSPPAPGEPLWPWGTKVADSINYLRKQNLDSSLLPAKRFFASSARSPLPLGHPMPWRHLRPRPVLRLNLMFSEVVRDWRWRDLPSPVLRMPNAMCSKYNCLIVSIYFSVCPPDFNATSSTCLCVLGGSTKNETQRSKRQVSSTHPIWGSGRTPIFRFYWSKSVNRWAGGGKTVDNETSI